MSTLTIAQALARHGAIALASSSLSRALGGRLFVKEVASVGEWVHPETGDRVAFSRDDIAEIAANTNRFIGVQGPIPFPDGHTFLSAKNLGYWPRVTEDGGRLLGIVEAGTPEIAAKLGTTIRGVSMYLEAKVRDSKGGEHTRVMTHIAATEYPVVTGQDNFIALSRDGKETRAPVYRPAEEGGKSMHKAIAALAAALGVSIEGLDEEKAAAGGWLPTRQRLFVAATTPVVPTFWYANVRFLPPAVASLIRSDSDENPALSVERCRWATFLKIRRRRCAAKSARLAKYPPRIGPQKSPPRQAKTRPGTLAMAIGGPCQFRIDAEMLSA